MTGLVSSDGTTWTVVAASTPIPMGATVHVGAVVASYSTGVSTAQFSGFGVYQQQAPIAPIDLAVTVYGGVRLTWGDASANETGFRVERRPVGGTFETLATLDAGSTAYTDAVAVGGTAYEWRVVAFNDAGENGSNVAGATVPDDRPPAPGNGAPPANVPPADDADGTTRAGAGNRIGWAATTGDADGYVVQRRTVGGAWADVARVGTSSTKLRDTTAAPGTVYEYRVAAFNASGVGEATGPTRVVTPDAPVTAATDVAVRRTAAGVVVSFETNGEPATVQRRVSRDWITLTGTATGRFVDDAAPVGSRTEYRARPAAGGTWSKPVVLAADATAEQASQAIVGQASGEVTFVRGFEHVDVTAIGGDVWSTEDGAVFAGLNLSGDFDVASRVFAVGDNGSAAGLMVRASDAADAPNAFVSRRGTSVSMTHRQMAGGTTATVAADSTAATWLRLARRGDTVHALTSTDGTTWRRLGTVNVAALGNDVRVGVAAAGGVSSDDAAIDARFREFRHLEPATGPTTLTATVVPGGVSLSWPRAGTSLFHTIERREPDGGWTVLDRPTGASYLDETAVGGVTYVYRVASEGNRPTARSVPIAAAS